MTQLRVKRGSTLTLTVPVVDRDGTPVDVTAWQAFRFTVKLDRGDADPGLWQGSLNAGVALLDAAAGLVTVEMPAAETADLPPGGLWWDIQGTDGSGRVVTLDEGLMYASDRVTATP